MNVELDPSDNIYQRLLAVRKKVRHVAKRSTEQQNGRFVAGFREYVGHDDVTRALQQAYIDWGIHREVTVESWQRSERILSCAVRVSWVNVHKPEERSSVQVLGEAVISGGKSISDKQSGMAISYAVKMAELKNLCLTGDDTPDNETVPDEPPKEITPELAAQLDGIQLAFADGNAVAVREAKSLMARIAPQLPAETVADFRRLAGDANARLRDD